MILQSITKNGLMLGLFAIAVAAGLAGTEMATREQREASERKVQSIALEQVIPASQRSNILLDDTLPVDDKEFLKLKKPARIFVARKDNVITGFIIPTTAPDGYSGAVHALVGIDLTGNIIGTRVISHNETPGLGDKVDIKKSNWVLEFNGTSLTKLTDEQWHVKKDNGVFDQFTGATITPRAVVKSIHNALSFFEKHKAELIKQASPQETTETVGEK
jgi:electron transport complex protein RnfG